MTDVTVTPQVPVKSSAPAAVSTSAFATSLAVGACWYIHTIRGLEVSPELAVALGGIFTGVLNFAAVIVSHFWNHRNDLTT